ncbi:imm11 family protein [Actinomadura sp. 6N118]|uniref:imm11 family protein n=1 Tax=Actinomadura sp. 6N118 TaxID=3375151 RepID=UPI0037BAB579
MADSWQPFQVWWDEEEREKPKGDFPLFASNVMVGARAVEALEMSLQGNGELLPLLTEGSEIYLYNVTRVVDALNMEKSSGETFPSGRYMHISKHVFVKERLEGVEIFKLPQLYIGKKIYVTDSFMKRIEVAGLTGLIGEEVWSSDVGPKWQRMMPYS